MAVAAAGDMLVQGQTSIAELDEASRSTRDPQQAECRGRCAGLVERIPDPEGGMARKFRIGAQGAGILDGGTDTRPMSDAPHS